MAAKQPDPKNDEVRIDPTNVSSKFLAALLGMTVSGLSKLYGERVLTQNGRRGKYDITEQVPIYIQSIKSSGTVEAGAKLKIQQERKLKTRERRRGQYSIGDRHRKA